MPRNPYPGLKLIEDNNYYETKISFEKLSNDPKLLNLIKPNYQGALNENKVINMINEYISNPEFFYFKNRIIIGNLNDKWYIIDGQHRVDMSRELFKRGYNNYIIFCWYKFIDENKMRELFISINKDSTKNQFYINNDVFNQIKISEFTRLLKENYKNYFSKKKSDNCKKKAIEEFRDNLIEIKFFNDNKTANELINYIHLKNLEFYNLNRYEINIIHNEDIFYKEELDCIRNKVIISLKNNNFIEWLKNNNNLPYHHYKKQKCKISKNLKDLCWKKEFNNNITSKCPITFCSNTINKNNFQAGHIISEFNGGKTNLENLKPICSKCNLSMGFNNWVDFDKKSC